MPCDKQTVIFVLSGVVFILLIIIKMPTINIYEQDIFHAQLGLKKGFITSEPD